MANPQKSKTIDFYYAKKRQLSPNVSVETGLNSTQDFIVATVYITH